MTSKKTVILYAYILHSTMSYLTSGVVQQTIFIAPVLLLIFAGSTFHTLNKRLSLSSVIPNNDLFQDASKAGHVPKTMLHPSTNMWPMSLQQQQRAFVKILENSRTNKRSPRKPNPCDQIRNTPTQITQNLVSRCRTVEYSKTQAIRT